jgi:hypothetical protein
MQNRPKVPLIPLPVVSGPFDRVAVDVLGPFPPTYKSNRYILGISGTFGRFCITQAAKLMFFFCLMCTKMYLKGLATESILF